MTDRIKLNDQVVLVCPVGPYSVLHGREGLVTGDFDFYAGIETSTGIAAVVRGFVVDFAGVEYLIPPRYLRLKRPPASDTGEQRIRALFDLTPAMQPDLVPV
jgi:hypothetical protein